MKLLNVIDEFTPEALAIDCRRRIDDDYTVSVLDRLVGERGTESFGSRLPDELLAVEAFPCL